MLEEIVIRCAGARDRESVARLAALEGRPEPHGGRALLALVGGEAWAALPLDGGPALADPFRPSAEAVHLLHARASQLAAARDGAPPGGLGRLRAGLARAWS